MAQTPEATLRAIQAHFHAVIRGRAADLNDEQNLKLQDLASPLVVKKQKAWFPIPGMYGGFKYWVEGDGQDALLVCESWCRVVGGSGQRHKIGRRQPTRRGGIRVGGDLE